MPSRSTDSRHLANVVVQKPWGHEYLVYENENLGIWYLCISPGQSTSLHCHPKKNTGFVVLDGAVKIAFLRGEMNLRGLDKIQIFRGRFHTTTCVSEAPAHIFEIEAPQDKHDLVRLKDKYGRAGLAYESAEHHLPREAGHLWITDESKHSFHTCEICVEQVTREDLMNCPDADIAIFLRGGVYHDEHSGDILRPGDVVNGDIMTVLADAFTVRPGTTIMRVRRSESATG